MPMHICECKICGVQFMSINSRANDCQKEDSKHRAARGYGVEDPPKDKDKK